MKYFCGGKEYIQVGKRWQWVVPFDYQIADHIKKDKKILRDWLDRALEEVVTIKSAYVLDPDVGGKNLVLQVLQEKDKNILVVSRFIFHWLSFTFIDKVIESHLD